MPLLIPKNDKLTSAEADIEASFSAAIQADVDFLVRRYLEKFGCYIDTDRARELCPAYCESNEARTRWSRAVYNPAKALVDEIYRRQLTETGPGGGRSILFTSGGTGAGKSTVLDRVLGGKTLEENGFFLLVDGTLSDGEAARAKIKQALTLGFRVVVVHVHRAFPETLRMVVRRAQQQGRVVTLDNIAATHFRARQTLFKLIAEFEIHGERFVVLIGENSLGHEVEWISRARLAAVPGSTVGELRAEAHALFHEEFADLKLSHSAIHQAFLQAGSRR